MRTNTSKLKGKRILGVDLRPFQDGRGGVAFDPIIYLDGGICLTFTVKETETDYGVAINITGGGKTR